MVNILRKSLPGLHVRVCVFVFVYIVEKKKGNLSHNTL